MNIKKIWAGIVTTQFISRLFSLLKDYAYFIKMFPNIYGFRSHFTSEIKYIQLYFISLVFL